MAVRVSGEDFAGKVLEAKGPVLADFYSDSCVPCKRLSPVLAEIEEEYGESISAVKINVNFDAELAEQYGVTAVPTVVFFKDGAEISRLGNPVKKADIVTAIENLK
ncbi:MAG: thioredoxin family protein [Oscillospiraceae bacterium]